MPGFGNNSTDVGTQLGVSERQGPQSARPEVSGRAVFQWQLDKARGVAPAQLIFSGMQAREIQLVNLTAIRNSTCGGAPIAGGTLVPTCSAAIISALSAAFPHGVEPGTQRWAPTSSCNSPHAMHFGREVLHRS